MGKCRSRDSSVEKLVRSSEFCDGPAWYARKGESKGISVCSSSVGEVGGWVQASGVIPNIASSKKSGPVSELMIVDSPFNGGNEMGQILRVGKLRVLWYKIGEESEGHGLLRSCSTTQSTSQ